MKLHRIEVTNLNSLYGTHTIDLDEDLAGASLFLIHGRTGAGKSTLMDAVSLAFFGSSPRQSKTGRVADVAEAMMSRGMDTSQALVEFSKFERDAGCRVRYRAAWLASRKRTGTMRDPERSLERLESDGTWGQLISSGKQKLYNPVFETVLEGFSMGDFQRSMLLAQGNFDALLRADKADRATILERLTDTGDYLRLGQRAARLNKAWNSQITRTRDELNAISSLTPEAIDEARLAEQEAAEQIEQLQNRAAEAKQILAWCDDLDRLTSKQADARVVIERVQAERKNASEELARLAEHERCSAAFIVLDEHRVVARRARDDRAALDALIAEVPNQQAAVEALAERVAEAGAVKDARAAELERLRPCVEAATRLAERLATATEELVAADATLAERRTAVERRTAAVETSTTRQVAAVQQLESASRGRERVANDQELSDGAADLDGALVAAIERGQGIAADAEVLEARQRKLDARRADIQRRRAAAKADRAARLAPLEAACAQAAERVAGATQGTDLPRRRASLETERESLREHFTRVKDVGEAVRRLEMADQTAESLHAVAERKRVASERLGLAVTEARSAEANARVVVRDCQVAVEPLEKIAELAQQRLALVPGGECPLCGSTEHPRVDSSNRELEEEFERGLNQAREALAVASAKLTAAGDQVATVDRSASAAAAAAQAATEEWQRAHAEVVRQREAATVGLAELGLAPESTADQLADALDAIRAEGLDAKASIERLDLASAAQDEALAALTAATRALDADDQRLAEEAATAEGEAAAVGVATDAHAETTARHKADAQALLKRLAAVDIAADSLQDARAQLGSRRAAYNAANEEWKRAMNESRAATAERDAAVEALATARTALQSAEAARTSRADGAASLTEKLDAAAAELDTLWGAGMGPDEPAALAELAGPRERLEAQIERSEAAARSHREAVAAHSAAQSALASARTRIETTRQSLIRLEADEAAVSSRLAAALLELDLDEVAQLDDRRMEPDPHTRAAERRRDLDRREQAGSAALAAVSELRVTHLEERAEPVEREAVERAFRAATEALTAQRDALTTAVGILKSAAREADRRAASEARLRDVMERARVWGRLHSLIGIADGERFRQFAQALNLEQLLRQANDHLSGLSDRYRLRVVADDNGFPTLDFDVEDGWQPGSRRSLKTLSGGESFLVSLALALGLSDLRTSSMPVETLLLDEGFGTLDPDTLEVALSALQQLQSTGRQVGIISHVVGLVERIEARICIEPLGEGRSRVVVNSG